MKKIVVFASGSGTNAENIIKYFAKTEIGAVEAVFTNNQNAQVIERVKKLWSSVCYFLKRRVN